jgi:hypothetical protein
MAMTRSNATRGEKKTKTRRAKRVKCTKPARSLRAYASSKVKVKAKPVTRRKESDTSDAPLIELPQTIKSVAWAVDATGERTGHLVVTAKATKRPKVQHLLDYRAIIQGNHTDVARLAVALSLYGYGNPKGLRELATLLIQSASGELCVVLRDGYHQSNVAGTVYSYFVFGRKLYPFKGESDDLPVAVCSLTQPLPSCTLKDWNRNIGVHLASNPYLLVAVCCALCALFIRLFRLPRVTLALIGDSGAGKNSVQQVVQSLIERAEKIESFAGTEKGIAAFLREYADRFCCMDEPRQAEYVAGVIRLLFDLGNGANRKTSSANQKSAATEPLSCSLIVSNEDSLVELVDGKRVKLQEGIGARYFEIHPAAPHGMFHHVPKGMSAAEFADMLKAASARYYGAVWPEWVALVAEDNRKLREWIPRTTDKICAELATDVPADDRVTHRLIRGLAGWGCAGIYAAKSGLLPTKPETVVKALRLVVAEHLARQRHATTPIGEQVIATVRDIVDRNTSKFPPFGAVQSTDQPDRLYGYRKQDGGELMYLFLPSVFEELVSSKYGTGTALRQLAKAGYLSTDSEGFQRQFRLPALFEKKELRKRFYAIRGAIRYEKE